MLSIDRIIVDILDSHNCVKKEKSRNNSLGPISKSSDSFDNESISPKDFVKVLKIEIFSLKLAIQFFPFRILIIKVK